MEGNGNREWLDRNRELEGRQIELWARRAGLLVLAALVVAALLNTFGQRTEVSRPPRPRPPSTSTRRTTSAGA